MNAAGIRHGRAPLAKRQNVAYVNQSGVSCVCGYCVGEKHICYVLNIVGDLIELSCFYRSIHKRKSPVIYICYESTEKRYCARKILENIYFSVEW